MTDRHKRSYQEFEPIRANMVEVLPPSTQQKEKEHSANGANILYYTFISVFASSLTFLGGPTMPLVAN